MHAQTSSAAIGVAGPGRSPSRSIASPTVRNGCSSWVWLARAVPANASPLYQGMNPTNIEITDR